MRLIVQPNQLRTSVAFADNHRTTLQHVRQRRTPENIAMQQQEGARVVKLRAYKVPVECLHDLFVQWARFRGGDDVDPPARNLTEEDLLGGPRLGGIPPNDLAALEVQIGEIVNG